MVRPGSGAAIQWYERFRRHVRLSRKCGPASVCHVNLEIATLTHDRFPEWARTIAGTYGNDLDETELLRERELIDLDRALAGCVDGQVVGGCAVTSRTMTVPGPVPVPVAGVTWCGVAATHRRRGIFRALMHRQIRDIAEEGLEPIAVLRPAEAAIYTRYGYGETSKITSVRIARRGASLRDDAPESAGSLRYADPGDVSAICDVYDQAWPARVGWTKRGNLDWSRRLADAAAGAGRSGPRVVVYRDPATGPAGYVLFRFDKRDPAAAVAEVIELVTLTTAAYAGLWRFVLGIDAADVVTFDGAPDEPLQYLLDDPRVANWATVDSMAARVIDLPRALESRRYSAEIDVVLDTVDELLPANNDTFRLVVRDGAATCERTDRPADLRMPIETLGAAYFGGTPLERLYQVGRVTAGSPDLISRVSRAFTVSPLPHYPASWTFPAY